MCCFTRAAHAYEACVQNTTTDNRYLMPSMWHLRLRARLFKRISIRRCSSCACTKKRYMLHSGQGPWSPGLWTPFCPRWKRNFENCEGGGSQTGRLPVTIRMLAYFRRRLRAGSCFRWQRTKRHEQRIARLGAEWNAILFCLTGLLQAADARAAAYERC